MYSWLRCSWPCHLFIRTRKIEKEKKEREEKKQKNQMGTELAWIDSTPTSRGAWLAPLWKIKGHLGRYTIFQITSDNNRKTCAKIQKKPLKQRFNKFNSKVNWVIILRNKLENPITPEHQTFLFSFEGKVVFLSPQNLWKIVYILQQSYIDIYIL